MSDPLTYEDLRLPHYLNTRVVGVINGVPITVTDAITAAHLAKLNVFVGGKKGSGKTQLLFDVRDSRFGGKGVVVEGRADLKTDEIFKRIDLTRLREGASSEEIIQLAKSVQYRFFGADELNRCPEITQNELLSIMNGYLLHHGEAFPLGDGFCVGLATGNLGNGEYGGTFRIDAALADRLHLFLNLDYWKPTDEDMATIDQQRHVDPRVKRLAQEERKDISDKLIAAHADLTAQPPRYETTLAGRYLERALDYCMKFPSAGNSKDTLGEAWPAICTQKACDKRDTLCGRVKAVGERTVQATKRLAAGIQYIAQLKNPQAQEDPIAAMMVAAKLVLPYSEAISKSYLREEGNFNNPHIAAERLTGDIERDIRAEFGDAGTAGPLTISFAYALSGRLAEKPYSPTDLHWNFAGAFLTRINEEHQKG